MTGGFTSVGAIPAIDKPMAIATPPGVMTRPKKKKPTVRQEAQALVNELLGIKNSR